MLSFRIPAIAKNNDAGTRIGRRDAASMKDFLANNKTPRSGNMNKTKRTGKVMKNEYLKIIPIKNPSRLLFFLNADKPDNIGYSAVFMIEGKVLSAEEIVKA